MNSVEKGTTPDISADSDQRIGAGERRIVAAIVFLVVLLTTLPYLLAFSISNTFVGQIYNIVDYSVYLSWTRQAADGHFASLNLFTTIKQHGYLFNCLFLVLGNFVRFTGLPIPVVFQVFRIVGAVVLLWVAYLLCRIAYPNSIDARLTSLGLIAFSSGFGFVYWPHWADKNLPGMSVDIWQPEAFTFLSIYTSVLFVIATTFILTAIYNLVRGEITGKLRYGVYAGLCGLVLGNIHSYDVLHIAAAWGLYLVVISIIERSIDYKRWLRAFVAGMLTLPSTVYQYWVFRHEPVFHARAQTPTLSPPFFYYMMGYGLVFLLAFAAIVLLVLKRKQFVDYFRNRSIALWIASWAVAGLTIIYLPVAFQRKMAMGEHIPLCVLAGGLLAYCFSFLSSKIRPFALCLVVALTFPTNEYFLTRDYRHIISNRSEIASAQPFLTSPQIDVLHWLKNNTKPNEAILALPPIGQFVPGYCDRAVWVGHWSETPDYQAKLSQLLKMCWSTTPDAKRYKFIESTQTTYFVYPTNAGADPVMMHQGVPVFLQDFAANRPPYLTPVYQTKSVSSNGTEPSADGYTIFRIIR